MHDVIVVGGGPVGLYTALLLRQAGLDAVVLERRTERSNHSRAIGIHPPALRALAAGGIADELRARGVPIRDGVARSAGRHVGTVSFSTLPGSDQYVLAVPQAVTEEILERRLQEQFPGTLRRGVAVLTTRDDGDRVLAVTRGPGGDATLEARLLVAADGARSSVRDDAGIRAPRRSYPDCYVMGDFQDSTQDGDDAVLYLETGGIVESFPLPGGVRRWVVRIGRPMDRPTAEDLTRLIRNRTGVTVDPRTNSMLSAFEVQSRVAERFVAGRTVLVGDAAHEVSPIGGQGMNLGWLDAVRLAPIIAASLRDGHDVAGRLALYERERHAQAALARRKAHINMALGRPLPAPVMRFRNAVLGALIRNDAVHGGVARAFTMQ
ncbi:FAD-dependent oxidoreductase [Arthrobacter agilis]|uniref:FAD-dependent oxidoreductase n=1 Tax=Arthrobacter agilis TaxID=37921 RepID=UPI002787C4EC|nr:NAD(P)/FAD-dependent oxidoreductase [Arthrobacter agilis]MDQ0733626.1 2-polyprenyl-6-methoxyphenol hydroxylase-like FAD-dependent oxidoreductase [Arthrobacter agilis]